jgi:virginiamycin B lyase
MRKGALLALVAAAVFASVFSAQVVGGQEPQGGRGQQVTLPDGAGKEIVQANCAKCHGLNMITNYWGDTRQGWETLFGSMIALPADQKAAVSSYLATHFPVKPATEAKVIPGPVNVRFREWSALSLGSRPHDPMAAADGSVWWSGQFASKLGRIDPRTNDVKEFSLPAGSGPHGLIEDRQGNVWYTGIQKHVVGKLDPKTGNVEEFPVQKVLAEARGPHTPTFDQKGNLWFTLQSGHVGRIIPSTGEMKISGAPSNKPGAPTYPYGIRVNSQGVPWYVDFRGNRIASVDPVTMVIKEVTLPNAESRPRRIAITSDDKVWYTDYTRGYLGMYDPKTGQHKEWPSPGGRETEPYGIVSVGNIVWYSESNVRPNTLVRFDPQTERFQTWTIPSGGHVVRHMQATANGNLVLAESGINKITLVEVGGNNRTN